MRSTWFLYSCFLAPLQWSLLTTTKPVSLSAITSLPCNEYPLVFKAALQQVRANHLHAIPTTVSPSKSIKASSSQLPTDAIDKCILLIQKGKQAVSCFPPDAMLQALSSNATQLVAALYQFRKEEALQTAGRKGFEEWLGGKKGFLLSLLHGNLNLYHQFMAFNMVDHFSTFTLTQWVPYIQWIRTVYYKAFLYLVDYAETAEKEMIPDHMLVHLGVMGGNVPILEDLVTRRGLKISSWSLQNTFTFHHVGVAEWLHSRLSFSFENDQHVRLATEGVLVDQDHDSLEWLLTHGILSGRSLMRVTHSAIKSHHSDVCKQLLKHLSKEERIRIWNELLDEQEQQLAKVVQDGDTLVSLPVINKFLTLSEDSEEWALEWKEELAPRAMKVIISYGMTSIRKEEWATLTRRMIDRFPTAMSSTLSFK